MDIRKKDEIYTSEEEDEYSDEEEFKKKKRKSKKIKQIVEIVYMWKKLVNGIKSRVYPDQIVKFKPKEAAEILGLPIKTMYDYMYSLKYTLI